MKYHQISGPMVFQPTGYVGNCEAKLKSGNRLLDEFDGAPLDAPEVIPSGSTRCIEWDSLNEEKTRVWFEAQRISIRSYQ